MVNILACGQQMSYYLYFVHFGELIVQILRGMGKDVSIFNYITLSDFYT